MARICFVTIGCLATTIALHATQGTTSQFPTFRSGVQLIEVDVTVRDQKGRLVRDLAADDFEITEDGAPQDVVAFRLVDLPIEMRRRNDRASATVHSDVTTNASTGRLYVVLLDNPPNVPWTHVYLTQRTARRFVNEALAPDDLTSVIDLHSGSGSHPFTKSRERLLESIERFGKAALGGLPRIGPEPRHDPIDAYSTMQFVAERLGDVGNRRKAIVWIGGMVPFHHQFVATAVAYREAVRAAERHNVAIYPVDPYGLTNALGRAELERVGALRAVAEDTGGYAVVSTNNFSDAYRRIVEENSTYYVLGYHPAAERQDGRFHQIRIRVKRPAMSVRARRGYTATTPESIAASRRPLPEGLSQEAADALRSMVAIDDLKIEVFAAPFMSTADTGSVLLGAQIHGVDLTPSGTDWLEISQLAIDAAGSIHEGTRKVVALALDTESRARLVTSGVRYFDRLELAPGRHEIRLAIHQPGGTTGSVTTHVDVPDFSRESMTMSGIVVSSIDQPSHGTLLHDERASLAVGGEPTVTRRFTSNDVLTIWAETYDGRKGGARPLQVTMRVAERDETVLIARTRLVSPNDPTAQVRTLDYRDRLDLSELGPGAYLLTIEASAPNGREKLVRHLSFDVR